MGVIVCADCQRPDTEVHLSAAGLCRNCASLRVGRACRQLQLKRGPVYRRWRQGFEAARQKQKEGIRWYHRHKSQPPGK